MREREKYIFREREKQRGREMRLIERCKLTMLSILPEVFPCPDLGPCSPKGDTREREAQPSRQHPPVMDEKGKNGLSLRAARAGNPQGCTPVNGQQLCSTAHIRAVQILTT